MYMSATPGQEVNQALKAKAVVSGLGLPNVVSIRILRKYATQALPEVCPEVISETRRLET